MKRLLKTLLVALPFVACMGLTSCGSTAEASKASAPVAEFQPEVKDDGTRVYKTSAISDAEIKKMGLSPKTYGQPQKIEAAGTYDIWNGQASLVTLANKWNVNVINYAKENRIEKYLTQTSNYAGKNAEVAPEVGDTLSPVNYIKLNTGAGKKKITVNYMIQEGNFAGETLAFVAIADKDGKILAKGDIGDLAKLEYATEKWRITKPFTFTAEVETEDCVTVGFVRLANGGGLVISSLEVADVQ